MGMRFLRVGIGCALIAACGHAPPAEPVASRGGARGCPAPSTMFPIQSWSPADNPAMANRAPRGWRVVLGQGSEQPDNGDPASEHDGPIDAAGAAKLGARPAPAALWLLGQRTPCRATVGPLLDSMLFGDALHNEISAPLDGCATDDDGGAPIAFTEDPSGCRFEPLAPFSERREGTDGAPAGGGWTEPSATGQPLPAGVTHAWTACEPPACERAWRVDAIRIGARVVAYQVLTRELARDPKLGPACPYDDPDDHNDFHDYWVRADGTFDELWAKDGVMRDHLTGVLYDASGPRYLVSEQAEAFVVWPIAGDRVSAPPAGARLWWRNASNDERSMEPHLGDGCYNP